ncbi:MAG TPA: phage holin family protein [Acidobacteriota bacterium]|nr:phage holin family protein [Acidobacteriota bacterium]
MKDTAIPDNPGKRVDSSLSQERSLGSLFADLSEKASLLVEQEVALAKKEIEETTYQAIRDLMAAMIGTVVALASLLVFIATAVLLLDLILPAWLAALLVGILIAVVGGILAYMGIADLSHLKTFPRKTSQSLARDRAMVKEKLT